MTTTARPDERARGAIGSAPGRSPASVLRHRDFRAFWLGALVSNVGTWMQNAAVPYVIFQLTGSSTWVGLSAFAVLFPGVVLGPPAGALADRLDRRRVVLWSQVASGVAAFALAAVWAAGIHRPGVVLLLVTVGGVVWGFSMPAWQGFIADLVPRDELPDAVTLNSMQFHGSRAIGPALGGIVLAAAGPSWAFVANAVSYVAVIVAVLAVRARPAPVRRARGSVGAELRDGFAYVRHHRGIATAVAVIVAVGFLGNPIVQLAPVFAERIYDVGAGQYGLLTAAFGVGAASGIWALGAWSRRYRRSRVLLGALVALGLAVVGFGLSPVYATGVVCVLLAGSAAVGSGTLLLTAVQLQVDDAYRGRVLGVYTMVFTASYPLGALVQGVLADAVGARANELLVGAVLLVLAIVLVGRRASLDALDAGRPPVDPEVE